MSEATERCSSGAGSRLEPAAILLSAALYLPLLAYLLYSSWLRWPDPAVDFGHFLYNAWVVSQGGHFGRDLTYPYGPLALLFYAGVFKAFGASVLVVYGLNAVFLALDSCLIHSFFRSYSLPAAVFATASFLAVFGLSQFIYTGNYNLMAPYKPEAAAGLPLLLGLVHLCRQGRRPFTSGLLLGSLLLTSTEFALAGAALVAVALCAPGGIRGLPRLALGALTPLLAVLLFLLASGHGGYSVRAAFAAVAILTQTSLLFSAGLRELMGIDKLGENIGLLLAVTAASAILAAGYAWALANPCSRIARWALGLALALLPAALLLGFGYAEHFWLYFPKALPACALLGLGLWLRDRERFFLLGLWSALSLALLTRMILNPMLHFYGFSLAMGATLLVFPLLMDALPRALPGGAAFAPGLKAFASALFMALLACSLSLRAPFFSHRNFAISEGRDPFYDWNGNLTPRGPALRELLGHLRSQLRPGERVLGLPDGHLVNYLLRSPRPTEFSLSLGELKEFGEARILSAYQQARPRFVFVAEREAYEGTRGFPNDFGRSILDWVEKEYQPVKTFGTPVRFRLFEARSAPEPMAAPASRAAPGSPGTPGS